MKLTKFEEDNSMDGFSDYVTWRPSEPAGCSPSKAVILMRVSMVRF